MTPEQEAAADEAYERGWSDSLDALDRTMVQPWEDRRWYKIGWNACAAYRWADPQGHGVAPDRDYREPRPSR